MNILKSIIRGFSYQLGKFLFFIIVALAIIYLLKGVDISWDDILKSIYYL